MSQVIKEPTHILDNSKSSIELIFTALELIIRYILIVTIK